MIDIYNNHYLNGVHDPLHMDIGKYALGKTTILQQNVEKILKLLASPKRPSYIVPSKENIEVYRGISKVQPTQLAKILEISEPPVGSGSVDFLGVIKPYSFKTVMSFSSNRNIINNFMPYKVKNTYSVIFVANTSDNPGMFIDMEGYYASTDDVRFKALVREKENLALGPVKLSRVEWIFHEYPMI